MPCVSLLIRGYYYIPHFVQKIDDETEEDTALLGKYRRKHEVLTHIPDEAYDAVKMECRT
jgi:penicillin-binding protein 2